MFPHDRVAFCKVAMLAECNAVGGHSLASVAVSMWRGTPVSGCRRLTADCDQTQLGSALRLGCHVYWCGARLNNMFLRTDRLTVLWSTCGGLGSGPFLGSWAALWWLLQVHAQRRTIYCYVLTLSDTIFDCLLLSFLTALRVELVQGAASTYHSFTLQ